MPCTAPYHIDLVSLDEMELALRVVDQNLGVTRGNVATE